MPAGDPRLTVRRRPSTSSNQQCRNSVMTTNTTASSPPLSESSPSFPSVHLSLSVSVLRLALVLFGLACTGAVAQVPCLIYLTTPVGVNWPGVQSYAILNVSPNCDYTCKTGYDSGDKCRALPCTMSDCSSPGTASVSGTVPPTGCTCTCVANYGGSTCATRICHESVDCNGRGTGISGGTYPSCVCTCQSGYTGNSCAQTLCTIADCGGSANAIGFSGIRPSCSCTCKPQFTGSACATRICHESVDCSGRGTGITGSYPSCVCTCQSGYTGDSCAQELCTIADCGGSTNALGFFGTRPSCSCTCKPEFTGSTCATRICHESVECNGRGNGITGSYPSCVCTCQSGYTGDSCAQELCTIADCGGSTNALGFFGTRPNCSCTCKPEFSGSACATRICHESVDCSGRGTGSSGTYPSCICTCQSGYTGNACQYEWCTKAQDCLAANTATVAGYRPQCQCTCLNTRRFGGRRCRTLSASMTLTHRLPTPSRSCTSSRSPVVTLSRTQPLSQTDSALESLTPTATFTRALSSSLTAQRSQRTDTATHSRSLLRTATQSSSRSLDLNPCGYPRLETCEAPTRVFISAANVFGGPPTCTVPSFRDWATVQGSSFISNASTAGSNQTAGGADPPLASASALLVGSGLVSLLFYLEANGAVPPATTPGSVASDGTFTQCGSTFFDPASMQLCGSGGLAVTLVAALATNTTAEADLWYAVAASDPPTAVRVEGILLGPLDAANATAAAASAHYTAFGGAGSRGRVALRLNLTLRVTVRMNVSLQDEPYVGGSGRLRFTPAPPVRIQAAIAAFPITVRAPQSPLSTPSSRPFGDLYDVARSVCRASPSGLNLTRPVTAVALLAISDVPDVRLSRPALGTALAVTTTVVATVGAIVSPGIAVQQGIAQALLGLGNCGGGGDQDDEDDALPVLSHPLRFGLGRGDGTPAEAWAASRRGALFSNLLLLPAAVALVAAFPGSFLAMLYLRRQQAPRSSQGALITMAVARDFVGFPSVALIPVIVTSEGTASAAVGLLQRGAAEGAAGDAVLGVFGLLACASLVVAWAVVLRRVLAAPARIHLQATAYAPNFQPRRWFPPWCDSPKGTISNSGSDGGGEDMKRKVWPLSRLFFPWAEWEAVPARKMCSSSNRFLVDASAADDDDDMALANKLEAEAAAARDLLRLDACIGEQWWRWAEFAGLTASLVVGVCEGLDTDGNVPACRAAAVIALLASVAQGVSALTSLAPLIGAGLAVGAVATVALAADAVARSVDSPAALSPAATERVMGVVVAVGLGALVAGAMRAAAGFFLNAALAAARASPIGHRFWNDLRDISVGAHEVDDSLMDTSSRTGLQAGTLAASATRRTHLLGTLLDARAAIARRSAHAPRKDAYRGLPLSLLPLQDGDDDDSSRRRAVLLGSDHGDDDHHLHKEPGEDVGRDPGEERLIVSDVESLEMNTMGARSTSSSGENADINIGGSNTSSSTSCDESRNHDFERYFDTRGRSISSPRHNHRNARSHIRILGAAGAGHHHGIVKEGHGGGGCMDDSEDKAVRLAVVAELDSFVAARRNGGDGMY